MDILQFIPSRDMREHLEKIDYEFNAKECAWLVYRCKTVTLVEKHALWQEIIDTMPDCEIVSEYLSHRSLHRFLKQYMEIESRSINQFIEPNDNAFYQYSWSYEHSDYKKYYKTIEECFSAALKYHKENDLISPEEEPFAFIDMVKLYDGDVHGHVRFNPDGQIISTLPSSLYDEEFDLFNFVFQKMNFVFPTPFKKGDILIDVRYKEDLNHNLMVFDKMDTTENKLYLAYGYVMDDGRIAQDGFNCLNLEYYKSDCFENEYCTLNYVRKYLLGDFSLAGLLNKYHQILCEEQAKHTAIHIGMWEDDITDEEWKTLYRKVFET